MGKTKTKSYALVSAANYSLVTMTAWSRVIDVHNSHVLNAWGCRKSNIVRMLKPHFEPNCAFCDTSITFCTHLV